MPVPVTYGVDASLIYILYACQWRREYGGAILRYRRKPALWASSYALVKSIPPQGEHTVWVPLCILSFSRHLKGGGRKKGVLMRRNYMLDVIIVLVTIVSFVAFIGFTEGCERL
jgi:hypothetical protein